MTAKFRLASINPNAIGWARMRATSGSRAHAAFDAVERLTQDRVIDIPHAAQRETFSFNRYAIGVRANHGLPSPARTPMA